MTSRTTFLILVLINMVLAGVLSWTMLMPGAAQPLPAEEHADQLLLTGEQPPAPEPMPEADEQVDADPVAAEAASDGAAVPASIAMAVPAPRPLCMRWGDFTTTQWREARNALRLQLAGVEIEEFLNEDKARYWVHLPALDSLEAARLAVADLKERGIDDSFIIQDDGPQHLTISLGLFSKKSMADDFVGKLKASGVENIISKPHPQSRYISARLHLVQDQAAALRQMAAAFEKTALTPAACPG